MSIHIGEVTSEVEVRGSAAAGGGGASPAPSLQPGWDEQARHRRVLVEERRERCRTDGAGFDG